MDYNFNNFICGSCFHKEVLRDVQVQIDINHSMFVK